jgi:hypothetical protein
MKFAAMLAGAVLAPAVAAAPASAAPAADITCKGGALTWTAEPSLTFSHVTVTFEAHANLGVCVSRKYPLITGGSLTLKGAARGGCPDGVTDGAGMADIAWNDGSFSLAQGVFSADIAHVGVPEAHVVSGRFAGETAALTATMSRLDWFLCLTPWGLPTGQAIIDTATLTPA